MMTAKILNQVEKALIQLQQQQDEDIDVVLTAGSLARWLEPLVTKVFGTSDDETNIDRGKSTIPPEEAVALGCAKHAQHVLADEEIHESHPVSMPTLSRVPVSPVSIGIGSTRDSIETLIPQGSPLPAHVVYTWNAGDSNNSNCNLWQVTPFCKPVAKLEDLPSDESTEMVLNLSPEGELSVSLQGGPIVVI